MSDDDDRCRYCCDEEIEVSKILSFDCDNGTYEQQQTVASKV